MTSNIVIVGGGAAGLTIFKELPPKVPSSNVILIDPRSFHVHLISSLRMIVTPEGNQSFMKHTASLTGENKRVVQGKVVSISDDDAKGRYVTLANGDKIDYTVLIVATGGLWSGPLAFRDNLEEANEQVNKWREQFKASKDVVLVGGGAVGFELAGEIRDIYPETQITIVHKQALPLNDAYTERWRRDVLNRVQRRGINVVLEDAVDNLNPTDGKIVTRSGRSIPADLVVPTFGSRPNTEYIKSLGSAVLNSVGEVRVQPTLQLPDHPRVFAAGDIVEWKEEKQSLKAMAHAGVIVQNVVALVSGQGKLKEHKSGTEMIFLTNGKDGGTSYLGFLWGIIFGDWFTSLLKSRTLLVDRMKAGYGLDK